MSSSRTSKKKTKIVQAPAFEQVGYLCRRIMQASYRDLQDALPELDVTIGQLGTMILIACNPGITPTEICKAQGQEKPTITASLDALVREKLVSRDPSKSDRRSVSLRLTAKGATFYNRILPRVRSVDRKLTRTLSDSERRLLVELLMRIYVNECVEPEAITGAPTLRLKVVGQPTASSEKTKSGRAKARATTHSAVLRQLRELERSSADLRNVVTALSSRKSAT
jgi:DNA-binding MarR family transcriptional regulator